jgi:hypothetical protein
MDEFVVIITTHTNIEPTTSVVREAMLNGRLNKLSQKEPLIYKKLKILLYQDTLNPFMETNFSKNAVLEHKKKYTIEVRYDNFCGVDYS